MAGERLVHNITLLLCFFGKHRVIDPWEPYKRMKPEWPWPEQRVCARCLKGYRNT